MGISQKAWDSFADDSEDYRFTLKIGKSAIFKQRQKVWRGSKRVASTESVAFTQEIQKKKEWDEKSKQSLQAILAKYK